MKTREQKAAEAHRHYLKHREEIIARVKSYRLKNLKKIRAYDRRRRRDNIEIHRERERRYRETHASEIRIRTLRRYRLNRDKFRAKGRANYRKHRLNRVAKAMEYARKNRKKVAAYQKEWQRRLLKKNPALFRARCVTRRAKLAGAAIGNPLEIYRFYAAVKNDRIAICIWCGRQVPKKKRHVDHVIPLARGGAHCVKNFGVSCQRCNHQKRDKMPVDFIAWRKKNGLATNRVSAIRFKGKALADLA